MAELRRAEELTQAQLAEKLQMSAKHLQSIELGQLNLTVRSLTRLADGLHVEIAQLFAAPSTRKVKVGRPRRPR